MMMYDSDSKNAENFDKIYQLALQGDELGLTGIPKIERENSSSFYSVSKIVTLEIGGEKEEFDMSPTVLLAYEGHDAAVALLLKVNLGLPLEAIGGYMLKDDKNSMRKIDTLIKQTPVETDFTVIEEIGFVEGITEWYAGRNSLTENRTLYLMYLVYFPDMEHLSEDHFSKAMAVKASKLNPALDADKLINRFGRILAEMEEKNLPFYQTQIWISTELSTFFLQVLPTLTEILPNESILSIAIFSTLIDYPQMSEQAAKDFYLNYINRVPAKLYQVSLNAIEKKYSPTYYSRVLTFFGFANQETLEETENMKSIEKQKAHERYAARKLLASETASGETVKPLTPGNS